MRVAIDTGGTFTDCVYLAGGQLRVLKVFSTPADPSLGILEALERVGTSEVLDLRHGTTVGTNAMLERKGARVAFLTTAGFEDTIAIGRQTRARLYDWFAPIPVCIVPPELRIGVPERVTAEAAILREPTDAELATLVEKVRESNAESVAVSLLFSFANPTTEKRVADALKPLDLPVSVSHILLPEFREYERGATSVVNAYLAPRMQRYLSNLVSRVTSKYPGSRVDVMQSSGGIIPAHLAAAEPVRTVLSGPAGGVIGACKLAALAGFDRILGFDMGGTSTDVFLADNGQGGAGLTRESIVAEMPISVPMLDIHTVGAGGGSIARFDAGGMLRVGPESAGADPGPACFGKGARPTVTDANMLLGRLNSSSFLGGNVTLDHDRAAQVLEEEKGSLASAVEFASGILRVVETNMEKAIRVISIERGHDPRDFVLVAFGGGGPLHACAIAQALRIPTVLVPAMPGALSAVGILLADFVRDYSRTVMLPGDQLSHVEELFSELEQRGQVEFSQEGINGTAYRSLDIRYRGQGYELNIPLNSSTDTADAFHELHEKRYGFSDPNKPLEIVNLRLRVIAPAEPWSPDQSALLIGNVIPNAVGEQSIYFNGNFFAAKLYHREDLLPGHTIAGPAMVTEYTSATILPPGCQLKVDGYGNLVITIGEEARA